MAREREDWRAVGTHGLRFHQYVVALLDSRLFDEFFTNVVAQLRLVFCVAPDEALFQAPWLMRDRQIHESLVEGDKISAGEAMELYLDDSERLLLNILSQSFRH